MLDAFLAELTADPADWQVRSVMADWLEDNGQPGWAEGLRWMVQNRKRPYHSGSPRFTWFNADAAEPAEGDEESDLPGPVYTHLPGEERVNHKSFPDLAGAEKAFLDAWVAARAAGWRADAT